MMFKKDYLCERDSHCRGRKMPSDSEIPMKRSKCSFTQRLYYPCIRLDGVEDSNLTFEKLSNFGNIVKIPFQEQPSVLLEITSPTKVYLEAVEKGDDRLELVLSYSSQEKSVFKLQYSPFLYVESDAPIRIASCSCPVQDKPVSFDILPGYLNALENSEALQGSFNQTCTLTIDSFLELHQYELLKEQLQNETKTLMGPPDFCRIGLIDTNMLSSHFPDTMLYSQEFIAGLEKMTGLDLAPPIHQPRIWSLTSGDYMMLNDERGDRSPEGLDIYICFCSENTNRELGAIQYISAESGEVVAKFEPKLNTLSMAYRSEGASRFIRYLPKSANLKGPIFHVTLTYQLR